MFDIGFAELVIISIVALLVLGPERLPTAVRTIALWIGRLKRGFASVKSEIEREVGADDIRRQLHNETVLKDLGETGRELTGDIQKVQQDINRSLQQEQLDTDIKPYQAKASSDEPASDAASDQPPAKPDAQSNA
ncbi:Sec-independent protein translocase protein TatB [Aestuariirhabdus sp. Z084]|uniref:Sec-independent protein translocase protein TatB n=1 Tax=Aestuariirhabdus haliotis TaxID=2918751 RepID=UPI00201B3F86|nr:Sec-independent protein translocase protein TatB [Aestuariirhabdus haliotis]MCL6414975.1 Sec-independent protein translocase protein TatB [Aestuariirhabdus haliotis]MCL6418907.1 Sec-independent protein translocase protein TatB [Aestuariirhabdus haliotis]